MWALCEGIVHVRVGHRLLIRQSECQSMASTDLICPVDRTDVLSCWLLFCQARSPDGCASLLCYLDEPTSLLRVAPYPGEASTASARRRGRWQSQTRRVNEALMTGVLCP